MTSPKPSDGMSFLNCPHVAEIILYVAEHPGCNKTAVYTDVARGPHMVDRLYLLEDLRLLRIDEPRVNVSVLTLTPRGERVAGLLAEIRKEIDG